MASLIVPMPLIRAFVGLEDQVDDKLLEMIGAGITARFQRMCGRTFFRTINVTEYHDADGGDRFVVDAPPVVGINDIWISPSADWDDTNVIDSQYYEYESDSGVVWWRNYAPPVADRAIKITYTSGWELKAMPEDLVRAFLAQLRHEYNGRDKMSDARITDAYGNAVDPIGFKLLPEVRATLDTYRLLRL